MHEDVPYDHGPVDDIEADCPRCGRECEVWAVVPSVVLSCDYCRSVWHCGATWTDMDATGHTHLEGD